MKCSKPVIFVVGLLVGFVFAVIIGASSMQSSNLSAQINITPNFIPVPPTSKPMNPWWNKWLKILKIKPSIADPTIACSEFPEDPACIPI
jgi:hypothetical protein